jgi:hypothetical protein
VGTLKKTISAFPQPWERSKKQFQPFRNRGNAQKNNFSLSAIVGTLKKTISAFPQPWERPKKQFQPFHNRGNAQKTISAFPQPWERSKKQFQPFRNTINQVLQERHNLTHDNNRRKTSNPKQKPLIFIFLNYQLFHLLIFFTMKKLFFLIISFIGTTTLNAQIILNGNLGQINVCDTLLYDSGGPNGNYGNNENFTMTLCPSVPNSQIKIDFLLQDINDYLDLLFFYDGTSVNAPSLGYLGHNTQSYNGIQASASNTSGCIT